MLIQYVDCINGSLLRNDKKEIIEHKFDFLPFRIFRIILEPNTSYTNNLFNLAKKRLSEITFNKANSSGETRDDSEIKYKSFSGLIIEQLCFSLLNHYNNNPNVTIKLDNSDNPINQIDLRIIKNFTNSLNQNITITKTVEIRSSFPFKPIEKAIASDFDILGFYKNDVKSGEIQKDFYIRFLFSLENMSEFNVLNQYGKIDYAKTATNLLRNLYFDDELNLKRNLVIYFIGGATKEMMSDDSIAYYGNMSSTNFNQNKNGVFKKIKIRNSLDSIAIMQLMLNCITDEAIKAK